MHVSAILLPVLAALAQAAPAPAHPPFSLMPGVGKGLSAAIAESRASATPKPMYVHGFLVNPACIYSDNDCSAHISSVSSVAKATHTSVSSVVKPTHTSVSSVKSTHTSTVVKVSSTTSSPKVSKKVARAPGFRATTTTTTTTTTSTTTKAPTTTTTTTKAPTTTSAAATTTDANSACATQPTGIPTRPVVDTDTAFQSYSVFAAAATSAATPAGFLGSFANQNAAVTQSDAYMTFYTLSSYDPQVCADYCTNTYGCESFNIFFERSPALNPAVGCADPSSVTTVKCSLFAHTIALTAIATNAGQWRGPGAPGTGNAFHVVIAGSNAYNYNKSS